MDRLSSISSYPTNGKRRVVSAESIAKRRYYPLDERDVDAAAWVLRQLDVAPTDKLAAFVFNTLPVRVAKARRLLDQRDRRHNGGHHHHDRNGSPVSSSSDLEVDRLIELLGAERVWRALDRATQPELPLRAAE